MARQMPAYCKHGTLLDAGDFYDKEDEQDCPLCFIESFPARNEKISSALAAKDDRIALLEAALRSIRDAMPGTDDAADRVQRLISKALQEQGE
jgi:hypothetical protein